MNTHQNSYIGGLSNILDRHPQEILSWDMKKIRSLGCSVFISIVSSAISSKNKENESNSAFEGVNYLKFKEKIELKLGKELSKCMLKNIRKNKEGEIKERDIKTINKKCIGKRFVRFVKKMQLNVELNARNIKKYVGEKTKSLREEQNKLNSEYLSNLLFETASGEFRSVSEIADRKMQMRAELYLEMRAADEICKKNNMTWMMITITLPGVFHSNPKMGKNTWETGTVIDDCIEFFGKRWNNLRKFISKKKNRGLAFGEKTGFGFKVIEPHSDGTPHWHIMLYCKKELKQEYKNLFEKYFKTSKNSVKFNEENQSITNSAAGSTYLFKYIIKYTGGEDSMNAGDMNSDAMSNVEAWRSAAGIRGFDRIGFRGEKTLFRNLRKLGSKLNCDGAVEFIKKTGTKESEFRKSKIEIEKMIEIATRKKMVDGDYVNDICYSEFLEKSKSFDRIRRSEEKCCDKYEVFENSTVEIKVRKTKIIDRSKDNNKEEKQEVKKNKIYYMERFGLTKTNEYKEIMAEIEAENGLDRFIEDLPI